VNCTKEEDATFIGLSINAPQSMRTTGLDEND